MRVFDFQCRNGHVAEHFVSNETTEVQCQTCGEMAQKILSAPSVKLEGWSGSFPGAAMRWEKDHELRAKKKPLD